MTGVDVNTETIDIHLYLDMDRPGLAWHVRHDDFEDGGPAGPRRYTFRRAEYYAYTDYYRAFAAMSTEVDVLDENTSDDVRDGLVGVITIDRADVHTATTILEVWWR